MTYLLLLASNPALAWGNVNDGGTFWMPPAVGDLAREIDATFYFIYWISVFFFVVLMGAMLYMAVIYRKRTDNDKTLDLKGSHKIELAWAIFLIGKFRSQRQSLSQVFVYADIGLGIRQGGCYFC